jgi:23S rRNA pseudouridine2605 synthase
MSDEPKAEASQVREGQRIAKVMARAGICSRRDAEAWIAEGRVSVNGEVLSSPAFNVSDADDVRVDGERLRAAERTRLFLFHKPRGIRHHRARSGGAADGLRARCRPACRASSRSAGSTSTPKGCCSSPTTAGSRGCWSCRRPAGCAATACARTERSIRRRSIALSGGITIDGVDYLGIEAKLDREQGSNVWITMGLREGKNREIKKVLEHLGLAVNRLIRVSFGPFELGDLAEGEAAEVRTRVLRDQLGVKLAKEASADFDAPLIARDAPTPTEPSADERSARRASAARERAAAISPSETASGGGAGNASGGSTLTPRPAARRRRRQRPSAGASMCRASGRRSPPTRRRRGNASSAAPPTTARGGRSRSSAFRRPARRRGRRAAAETQKPRAARHNAGKRGPEGRERPLRSDNREGGRSAEFERRPRAERREGGPRERSFDRPQGRKHDHGGEGRPPRADAKDRGPRSEFKPRGARTGGGATALRRARRFDRSSGSTQRRARVGPPARARLRSAAGPEA